MLVRLMLVIGLTPISKWWTTKPLKTKLTSTLSTALVYSYKEAKKSALTLVS